MNTSDQLTAMRGHLSHLLDQIHQMKGMFPDTDGQIAAAIAGAEEAVDYRETHEPLDQYENCLVQYLKRSGNCTPRLDDLRAIWGWRCGIDPQHVRLTDLAESLYTLCERLDLLGPSFSNFPGGRGGFGVIADAAPERVWALSLMGTPGPGESSEKHYWFRIVAVLCSRLRMSEVVKLPGYKHNASAGPFNGQGAMPL